MTASEQIDHFSSDLDALVNRYATEFDLPVASAIGVLFLKAHELSSQDFRPDEDRDPEK